MCKELFAVVDNNLTLSRLQSRQQHIYHRQPPMPESTLTLCQSRLYPPVRDLGFGLRNCLLSLCLIPAGVRAPPVNSRTAPLLVKILLWQFYPRCNKIMSVKKGLPRARQTGLLQTGTSWGTQPSIWGANRGHTEKTSILERNRHRSNDYKDANP